MLNQQMSDHKATMPVSSMDAMIKFIEQGYGKSQTTANKVELSFQRSLAAIPFQETHLSVEIQEGMKNMVEAAQVNQTEPMQMEEDANLTSEDPSSSEDQSEIVKKQIQFHYGERESLIQQQKSDLIQSKDSSSNQPQVMIQVSDEGTVREQIPKTKIHKIIKKNNKCLVCKSSGRKSEMKKCCRCHLFVHHVCLQAQSSANKSHYVCQRCEFKQNQKSNKIEVVDLQSEDTCPPVTSCRINIQKIIGSQRRMNKCDKRSQQLLQFQQKYPNLIDGQNIIYPIDDRLLILYPELTQVEEKRRIDPSEHPIVPSCWLGDLLQIENWLITFGGTLTKNFASFTLPYLNTKEYLFTSIQQQGQDPAFRNLLCTILRLFLSDLLQNPRKENMRMLSENHFFQLLGQLNQHGDISDQFLATVASEILRHLAIVPSFLHTLSDVVMPQTYDCGDKIAAIIELLKALNQTNSFRLLATRKTESIQELVDLKGKLITKIKTIEAGRLQNKQKLIDYQNQAQKESKKDGKSKSKKKFQQLQKQNASSQVQLGKAKQQLEQCLRSLHFATSEVLYLGRDRNGCEYFFPRYEPFRVYVRYRRYFLDFHPQYAVYEGQDKILEVARTLSNKGVNQKRLGHNIHILNKLKLFQDKKGQPQTTILSEQLQIRNYRMDQAIVVNFLLKIQRQYHIFLKQRGFEWVAHDIRQNKLLYLRRQQNLNKLAQQINSLQESFQTVEYVESEFKGERPKKKVPMRIWGTTSDKIRRCWTQYLLKQPTFQSLWVSLYILKIYVKRFITRRLQNQSQQQRKNEKKMLIEKNDKEVSEKQQNNKQSQEKSEANNKINLNFQDSVMNQEEEKKPRKSKEKQATKPKIEIEKRSYQESLQKVNKEISNYLKAKRQKKVPKQKRSKQLEVKEKNQKGQQSQNKMQEQQVILNEKNISEEKKQKKNSKKLKQQIFVSSQAKTNNNNSIRQLNMTQQSSSSDSSNHRLQELTSKNTRNMISSEQEKMVMPIIKRQSESLTRKICGFCGQKEPKTFIDCSKCQKYYHLKCSGLNRRPRNEWICRVCAQTNNGVRATRRKG